MVTPPPPFVTMLLHLVAFGMLFTLAILWGQSYRETRSRFSLGLVLFASVLALQEVLRLLFFMQRVARTRFLGPIAPNLEFAAAVGEVIALGILIYTVSR